MVRARLLDYWKRKRNAKAINRAKPSFKNGGQMPAVTFIVNA
jgi:hypothetical protein